MRATNWPQLNPGRLRHKIIQLEPVAGSDASGVVTSFQPAQPPVFIRADIEYLRGDEAVKAGLDVGQTYLLVTAWYRADFSEQDRILAPDGATYIIQTKNNVRLMNVVMELTCQRITNPA
jgi:head-tail adaptor